MFRGTARSFGQDSLALAVAMRAFEAGDDALLHPIEVSFLLMPYMHAEELGHQRRALDGFTILRDAATEEKDAKLRAYFDDSMTYAERHKSIIERFGRFPHRNAILARPSTTEEIEFLKQPGSSF
jgi:uncharacterized protein (DUF924 family)